MRGGFGGEDVIKSIVVSQWTSSLCEGQPVGVVACGTKFGKFDFMSLIIQSG